MKIWKPGLCDTCTLKTARTLVNIRLMRKTFSLSKRLTRAIKICSGKSMSVFVLEIIKTSTVSLIWFMGNSNFFRIEFILRWVKISLYILSFCIVFKMLLESSLFCLLIDRLEFYSSEFEFEFC